MPETAVVAVPVGAVLAVRSARLGVLEADHWIPRCRGESSKRKKK